MSATISLQLFTSGTIDVAGVVVPVPFFLIRHPQGDVLVDGGNPLAVASDPRAHWGPIADEMKVTMSAEQHCVAQLRAHGIARESIRYLVQTHLHLDHTGALGHFPDATVLVDAAELDAARSFEGPYSLGYVRADFERADLDWRVLTDELDLFADGSIRLLRTPGHSAGHRSILLSLADTGPVLLTADAADNAEQWQGRRSPRALSSREDAQASLQLLRELAAEHHALVIFGHDPENWAGLRHAPQHYA